MPRRRQLDPSVEDTQSQQFENTNTLTGKMIKLPPFLSSDPVLWFIQVEAVFSSQNITDTVSKYNLIIASLSPEVANDLRDTLIHNPYNNSYEKIKSEIIKRTTLTDTQRIQVLLSNTTFNCEKPSQILRHMQQLLEDRFGSLDTSMFKEMFLQRLPIEVRMILATHKDTIDINELANMADTILQSSCTSSLNSCSLLNKSQKKDKDYDKLFAEVTELKNLVYELIQNKNSLGNSRNKAQHCWYHEKFGRYARKCIQPCTWTGNGEERK